MDTLNICVAAFLAFALVLLWLSLPRSRQTLLLPFLLMAAAVVLFRNGL